MTTAETINYNAIKIADRKAVIDALHAKWQREPYGIIRDRAFDDWYAAADSLWEGDVIPFFKSIRAACEACRWDKHIKPGRVFMVPSEELIGISGPDYNDPIIVTARHARAPHQKPAHACSEERAAALTAAVDKAISIAKASGYPLAEWAAALA